MKKYQLILEFDSKEDSEQWLSWYINSGEQSAEYYWDSNNSTKNKLKLYSVFARCHKCKSMNLLDLKNVQRLKETIDRMSGLQLGKITQYKKSILCEDCKHNFDLCPDEEINNDY